jgi:cytochrome c556
VVTAELVDIARRLPPPLSTAETALRDAMVEISATNTALRAGLTAPDAARVKEQVAALKRGFTTAQGFFTERKAADAVGWSGEALKLVSTMESAAGAARWDDVRGAVQSLAGLCSSCHTARRERFDDGSYRFKAGN